MEVSLTANQNISKMRAKRQKWSTDNHTHSIPVFDVNLDDDHRHVKEDKMKAKANTTYELTSLQIRTFIVSFT